MKFIHNNLDLIESWLTENGLTPSVDHDFVRTVYHSVLEHRFAVSETESVKGRKRAFSLQYDFVRRDLLKIMYRRNNNSSSGIKCGYVYAIGNPAWKDYVKIGVAIDVKDRLSSYQTSSPLRDYFLIDYYFVDDRLLEESNWHSSFSERNNEWCKTSIEDIKMSFRKRKQERIILPKPDVLYVKKDISNSVLNKKKNDWYVVLNVEHDDQ